jgi:hypothetical protein
MVNLEVLNPVADKPKRKFELAPRLGDLRGKTIGLYWNGKPGGNVIRERTAQLLSQKVEGIRLKEYRPAALSMTGDVGISTEVLETIVKECHAVIGTTAD